MVSEILAQTVPLQNSGGGGGNTIVLLLYLALIILTIAGMWKAFEKAGEPGWAAIVPFYNTYVMIKIGGNAWWWLLLLFVPIVNLFAWFKLSLDVAKSFGEGLGIGVGLWLLSFIFWPLLGFGDYEYEGAPA